MIGVCDWFENYYMIVNMINDEVVRISRRNYMIGVFSVRIDIRIQYGGIIYLNNYSHSSRVEYVMWWREKRGYSQVK